MKSTDFVFALLGLALLACEHATTQPPELMPPGNDPGAGNLIITTSKTEYTWRSNDLGRSGGIQATIINRTQQTYYANLGDRFNSSIDQDNLVAAEGTGGFIEQFYTDGAWISMPRGLLIEGSRFVALRPQKIYQLSVLFRHWRGDETGFFRIKVEYFDQINPPPGASPYVDYSPVFKIGSR